LIAEEQRKTFESEGDQQDLSQKARLSPDLILEELRFDSESHPEPPNSGKCQIQFLFLKERTL